jgi:predicted MFS family arabinose efflux permease
VLALGASLERTNSVSTTTEHLGYVLGAPLAGLLIAAAGAPATLWLDAGSFVLSALFVTLLAPALRGYGAPVDGLPQP